MTEKEKNKERLEKKFPGAMNCIKENLKHIGENENREGLLETPYRITKSWEELYKGYQENPTEILGTVFKDDIGELTDEIVMIRKITFYSMCEHHCLPFSGFCHIGYLPNTKVVGASKLVRLVEVFARRMQIQEKLTSQIATTLMDVLQPRGVGVIIVAQHQCMTSRGVKNQTSEMITSAMRGRFKDQPQTRNEFLSLINI